MGGRGGVRVAAAASCILLLVTTSLPYCSARAIANDVGSSFRARLLAQHRCGKLVSTVDRPVTLLPNLVVSLPPCVADDDNVALFGGLDRQRCVSKSMMDLANAVHPTNPGVMLCVATALVGGGVLDDCHIASHTIGQYLWVQAVTNDAPRSEAELVAAAQWALSMCPLMCTDGCNHPVLEGLVASLVEMHLQSGNTTVLQSRLQSALQSLMNSPAAAKFGGITSPTMNHGIGHIAVNLVRGPVSAVVGTGLAAALSICTIAPVAPACENGVMMEWFNEEIMLSGNLFNKSFFESVCNDINGDLLHVCGNAVGEALVFSSCHDYPVARVACDSLSRTEARAGCLEGLVNMFGFDQYELSQTVTVLRDFGACVTRESPEDADGGKHAGQLVEQFFKVVACDETVTTGCCGDAECSWLENGTNCPGDCAAAPAGDSVPKSTDTYAAVQQLLVAPHSIVAAYDNGRCRIVADSIPFCGSHVSYPVAMSVADAAALDHSLRRNFAAVAAMIKTKDTASCTEALAREYCLAAFPICEGVVNLSYCSQTRSGAYDETCGAAFVCRSGLSVGFATAHVCGPGGNGDVVCLVDGGHLAWLDGFGGRIDAAFAERSEPACSGLVGAVDDSQSSTCAAAQARECNTEPELRRCFDRRVKLLPDGSLGEVFIARGGSVGAAVLWDTAADSVLPFAAAGAELLDTSTPPLTSPKPPFVELVGAQTTTVVLRPTGTEILNSVSTVPQPAPSVQFSTVSLASEDSASLEFSDTDATTGAAVAGAFLSVLIGAGFLAALRVRMRGKYPGVAYQPVESNVDDNACRSHV